jgi:hypothetical protein
MAGKFCDGFDYLVAANLNLKWDSSPSWSIFSGVYGKGKAVQGNANPLTHTLATNYASGMCAFHLQSVSLIAEQIHLWSDTGTIQVDLRRDVTGAFFFTRNGTTIGSTSSYRISAASTNWIEAQVIIHGSLGQANLYVNGVSVLTQTGLNTQATGNSYFNQISLKTQNANNSIFDNYHFWDFTVGDAATGFPYGEHIIEASLAIAVGTNTTWNRGGTNTGNNYSQVNEANEDGDTTYVWMSSSGAGDIDSYGFATQQTPGSIGFVAINTIVRIDDAGPHTYEHYTLSSGSSNVSAALTPGASYLNIQTFQGTDPHTSALWTTAGRNAAEFGFEFIS